MYLVDTNVISLMASGRENGEKEEAIASWMEARNADLFLSVVTISELEAGIARLRRVGAHARSAGLRGWLDAVVTLYYRKILPLIWSVQGWPAL